MRTLVVEANSHRIPLSARICRCEGVLSLGYDQDGDSYCLKCGRAPEAVLVAVEPALPKAPKTIVEEALEVEAERKRLLNLANKRRWRERHAVEYNKQHRKYKEERRLQLKKEGRSTHRP